mmetsp:Transcript_12382/g.37779  ORF Transcript_12382/g.37779 Transcript_12382/m.37779 type:complete len:140 (+) Transcript_12382:143-562(+)|eukprot:CAMPEP_0198727556 /NCGR_PEP_ID=MMETSP1475-20131203/4459_1 /TAXON_ID= ORGANISM="Unidentified sp., Strain CCMP1999" /NCGR_SAMPLE_ID=MMETSP1475 /ASSEMBLY_ACC=CAM_ASM_001111 /LENGTH=139 /DNA_ID=CAMNT_0044489607 /DNA_START=112 /DNA_END=531 /DNA_ORIENTATION=+
MTARRERNIGDRAKLFKEQPKSRAEAEARSEAIEFAEQLDREESTKAENSICGKSKDEINRINNRKSAKVSRALKQKYITILEEKAKVLNSELNQLRVRADAFPHNEAELNHVVGASDLSHVSAGASEVSQNSNFDASY